MAKELKIPLKYKFLSVLMFTITLGFSTFFALAYRTFSEDKKLFVMELNLSILKTAISDTRADLKSRVDELQISLPKIYENSNILPSQLFREISVQYLPGELLGVRFYRRNLENSSINLIKEFKNTDLLQNKSLPDTLSTELDKSTPLELSQFNFSEGTKLFNRSLKINTSVGETVLPVLTFLVPGNFVNDNSKTVIIVVDIIQDFLRKKLNQSEIAEVFLINKNGLLLSHSSLTNLFQNTQQPFNHPIAGRLKNRQLPKESLELLVNNENYLCNISETALPDIYAVSQIKRSEAFQALKVLMRETLLTGGFILSIALILSIIFSNTLTSNIKKLKEAAEAIGHGNLDVNINVKSNDEIQSVASSFAWMSSRIKQLIKETITKERMTKELETAKLIQSTLLSSSHANNDAAQVEPFYLSASECGGDIWDAYQMGSTLTALVGDATGHGAAAAIVTAVAKSCFLTLNSVYSNQPLKPDQFLHRLNQVLYESCKGKLLMTMSVVQLDLSSGELTLSNAGHEAPLLLRASNDPESKNKCEPLFVSGERLGFAPDSKFENFKTQLIPGDTLLIYTDGVSEAINADKKQFGERAIKKLFNRLGTQELVQIKTQLYEELKSFMGDIDQQDDITYVLLKWHHKIEKIETESLISQPTIYNEVVSRVISHEATNQKQEHPSVSLIELAKKPDFTEEEIDTHYARIDETMKNPKDPSEGEAA